MDTANTFTPPTEGILHYIQLAAPAVKLGLMLWYGNTIVITPAGENIINKCLQIPAVKEKYAEMCNEASEFAARAALITSYIERPALFKFFLKQDRS